MQAFGKKEKKADIVDVARVAKVSISTVSRSFNHPELVRPSTRKRIDEAVRRLGYIRNRAAQAMHGIRNGTIGLVVPTIDHAIFAEMVQAFSDAVSAQGFTILLTSHGYDLEKEYSGIRTLLEHRVDGIALVGFDHSEESYQLIESQGIPAITLWNFAEDSRLSCVGSDNRKAGAMVTQHLLGLGHRKIATMFPPVEDNDRARNRLLGADGVLTAQSLSIPSHWCLKVPYHIGRAKEAAIGLFQASERPTAVLCGNDVLGQGVIYAAMSCGLAVPGDVSVAAIGDFTGSDAIEPPLTTVRIPARTIGATAGQTVIDRIAAPDSPPIRHACAVTLVERASTAPVAH